jgi:hypothetical protein
VKKTNRSKKSKRVQDMYGPQVRVKRKGRDNGSTDKGLENNRAVQG